MSKVAICFYGQPRFYKQVLPIWKQIIEKLDADVFIHTWFGQDRAKGITDVNELVDDFNPKELKVSSPHRFLDVIPPDSRFENQSYHGMQQSYTLSNAFEIFENYEMDLKKSYDVVIRCRMDIEVKYPNEFIQFVKGVKDPNKIYVCSNHWSGSPMFDDNMMVGNSNLMKSLFLGYYDYTIDRIHKTKIISGGEQNIFRYISSKGHLQNITKVKELDFELLYIPAETLILNQNE